MSVAPFSIWFPKLNLSLGAVSKYVFWVFAQLGTMKAIFFQMSWNHHVIGFFFLLVLFLCAKLEHVGPQRKLKRSSFHLLGGCQKKWFWLEEDLKIQTNTCGWLKSAYLEDGIPGLVSVVRITPFIGDRNSHLQGESPSNHPKCIKPCQQREEASPIGAEIFPSHLRLKSWCWKSPITQIRSLKSCTPPKFNIAP